VTGMPSSSALWVSIIGGVFDQLVRQGDAGERQRQH
jgi:hypothetical protein